MSSKMRRGAMALAVLILASGGAAALADEPTHMKFVERASSDTVTDLGAKGDSVGDVLTFSNPIFDEANATQVGQDNGWCIRTVVGQAWECFWTLTLDKGQITVEGPYFDAKDSVLAVTGGTGAFAGMSGEMALHARDAQGSAYDFAYTLSR
jgi:allene oxide cyclase